MRTNKQSAANIKKASSFSLRGNNELTCPEMDMMFDAVTNDAAIFDENIRPIMHVAYNLGYLRGMQHDERTTFHKEIIKAIDREELIEIYKREELLKNAKQNSKNEVGCDAALPKKEMSKEDKIKLEKLFAEMKALLEK